MKFSHCLLVASTILAGCGTVPRKPLPTTPDPAHHVIYIDRFGYLLDPVTLDRVSTDPSSDDLAAAHAKESEYITALLKNFVEQRRTRKNLELTLYIHGGLNLPSKAVRRSDRFARHMLDEGQYPVFICWHSSGPTNWLDHAYRIRKGQSKTFPGVIGTPFVVAEDVARSVVRIPAATYKELFADPLTLMKSNKSEDEKDYQLRVDRLRERGFNISNREPYTGIASSYWTGWNPVRLATAPVVDGFGTGAWTGMLRRTDLVLSKSAAFEGAFEPDDSCDKIPEPQRDECVKARRREDRDPLVDTAATEFLKRWQAREDFRDVRINLIGHSMGSIVANNILARHPKLPFHRVVYMGAAARIKDLENVLVPWLRQPEHQNAHFYNLSLDPYREISERNFADFLPRGSLLNWIDNTFGDVHSFKDRTAGSWWNIVRTAEDVFPDARDVDTHERTARAAATLRSRVHLSRFPIGGDEMGPQGHGDFGDYCFWRDSFWTADAIYSKHPETEAGGTCAEYRKRPEPPPAGSR